jgi:hypothetical protein
MKQKPKFRIAGSLLLQMVVVALFGLLSGCAKDDLTVRDQGKPEAAMSQGLTRADLIGNRSVGEVVQVYRTLSSGNKYDLWQDKLQSNKRFFTRKDQLEYIDQVLASMKKLDFESPVRVHAQDVAFLASVQNLFTNEEAIRLFCMIQDFDAVYRANQPNSNLNCHCAWDVSCGGGQLCDGDGCTPVDGCGFLWLSKCEKVCDAHTY